MKPIAGGDKIAPEPEKTDVKCEKCGGEMVIKTGPYGRYYQCLDDKCKFRKGILVSTGVKCPKDGCEGELVQRKSRFGTVFYGCSKYPDCDFVLWKPPTGDKCPDCGSLLIKNTLKRGTFIQCSNTKACKYKVAVEEETAD